MALKITLFLLAIIASAATATRDLPEQRPGFNLAARLQVEAEGGLIDCWNALTEIKSCSNEIVLFFVNGTTDIGPACCHAITMITHHCWPAMLTALGFTPDETNILRGYCDGSESAAPAPYSTAPALPPAAADAMMIV